MNQVALVGRITKDPILRKLSQDRVQTSIIIAINRNYKNTKGEIEADFILCSLFGRLAENTAKHCGKGSLIGLSGRIQSRTYEREDQSRVFVTEVIGD
ncbi:single-stranded DNA-binding protein, partial [Microvirga sp. 3-52]|nr:single-stranded DNA-binding protein [Microvirga sp. 3-52]